MKNLANPKKDINKTTATVCTIIGAASFLLMVFLLLFYLFGGALTLFDLNFSLLSFGEFIDGFNFSTGLSTYDIIRLVISLGFILAFLFIAVFIVVELVNVLVIFIGLFKKDNTIDYKTKTTMILDAVTTSFSLAIGICLISVLTAPYPISIPLLSLISVFSLFFISRVILKNAYTSNDVKKGVFVKNTFFLNVIKNVLLVVLCIVLIGFNLSPQLKFFVDNLSSLIDKKVFTVSTVLHVLIPMFHAQLCIECVRLLTKTICGEKPFNKKLYYLYGRSHYLTEILSRQKHFCRHHAINVIIHSVIVFVLELITTLFENNVFTVPENFTVFLVSELLVYLPLILSSIALYFAVMIPEREVVSLLPKTNDPDYTTDN